MIYQNKYDNTKADHASEKFMDKYIYASPLHPLVFPVLVLDVWFALEGERLGIITSLFGLEITQEGATSSQYTTQLSVIVHNHMDHANECINPNHTNMYGVQ